MTPTSAQHAALRILLEDVQPLLAQADELTTSLGKAREELHADLDALAALVQRGIDAQPALLDATKKVTTAAARIESATTSKGGLPPPRTHWRNSLFLPLACLMSSLMAAALVALVLRISQRDLLEEARVGRALQSAWSSLDPATQLKLHQALRR